MGKSLLSAEGGRPSASPETFERSQRAAGSAQGAGTSSILFSTSVGLDNGVQLLESFDFASALLSGIKYRSLR